MKASADPESAAGRELRTSVDELACGIEQLRGLRRQRNELDRHRQGRRELGIAQREVVVLDREDVGEVRGQLDRELDPDRITGEVGDDEVLLQVVGHEALVADQQLVGLQAAGQRVAEEERSCEVLDLARRERHRPLAVDAHGEP